ncbi:MAG TPA: NTP transferase domain-containing protein [Steroidobacteraceae bacterium]|nr:NTP transferase domain-containing protein [Steroidobacteraceae bacterium]
MPPDALHTPGLIAVVMAAQRPGVVDPLAAGAGVSHKCLVPIGGQALIAHVVAALQAAPEVERIRIVVEPGIEVKIRPLLAAGPAPVEYIASAPTLPDSVYAATRETDQPTLITAADNVLLTPGAVTRTHAALRQGADVVFTMARKADVLAAHPEGQRRFYRFRDDAYSNCNLFGIAGARTLRAAEMFRSGGQFAKKPLRLIGAIGPMNLALFLLGWLTLDGAMARLSRQLRLRTVTVVLEDGAHAVDVDNARTYRVASILLQRRAAAPC